MIETIQRKHRFDMVHGTQELFRLLLEALANPGRVLNIRLYAAQFAGQGRWLAPAVTLLDQGTGFYWDGDAETGDEIRFLTGAPRVPLEEADFVFLSEGGSLPPGPHSPVKPGNVAAHPPLRGPAPVTPPQTPECFDPTAFPDTVLARVKAGTHLDPHESALLFIAAKTGNSGGETLTETVRLKGPGIPPEGRTIRLSPTEAAWCRARDRRGFEYPCGVELVFLREDYSLLALTRKTEFLWG